jgi:hypothetical protein
MFTTFKQCPEFAVIYTRSGHMVVSYNLRVVVMMKQPDFSYLLSP